MRLLPVIAYLFQQQLLEKYFSREQRQSEIEEIIDKALAPTLNIPKPKLKSENNKVCLIVILLYKNQNKEEEC
jgi:hypothetical protein